MHASSPPSTAVPSHNRILTILLACEATALRLPLRFAMLAALALVAATVALLRIGYETNDDVFLTMIVSGRGFCPRPDEHLIFSNVLLGHLLKWLYEYQPRYPWYGSYLLLTHYLAQVAILYCALTINPSCTSDRATRSPSYEQRRSFRRRIGGYLICFLVGGVVLLNNLQFTSTAFIAAQAGIFLLWTDASRPVQAGQVLATGVATGGRAWFERLQKAVALTAAVILLVLASLIRIDALAMAILVAIPLFAGSLLIKPRRALIRPAAAVGVAAILIFAAARYNSAYYADDPAWRHFYAFNNLRVKFNDYGWTKFTPETAPDFAAVGWTKNDHDILARYYFDDATLYSESRLRQVLNAFPWKTARLTSDYFVEFARRVFRDRAAWAVVLTLPFLFARLGNRRDARYAIAACSATAVVLIAWVTLNNKVPPMRVYFPLLTFPLFATLLFPVPISAPPAQSGAALGQRVRARRWLRQPRWSHTVATLLIVGLVMSGIKQISRSAKIENGRATLDEFVAQASMQPQKLYVCWEAALPFELISPLDNLATWSNITTFNLAWMQRTPWLDEIKDRFRIPDVVEALYRRDDLMLIATDQHKLLFATYVHEHFGAHVEFVPWFHAGKRFVAGRFRERATAVEAAARPATGKPL